jgi:alkanesulfonate monooxygenase SsuD/methylene tetrahydromethanopterin reductase-like flavin-dependent oxidoreductase (luciferase family)
VGGPGSVRHRPARYEHGFTESLDLLLAGLTGDRVAAASEHFAFREVAMVPQPAPGVLRPVTVACTSRSTVELAAARGLPMLLGLHIDDAEKKAMVDHYAAATAAAGHDPRTVAHVSTVLVHVADNHRDARRQLRASMPGWLTPGLAGYRTIDHRRRPQRDPHAYTDMLCDIHPIGSPEQCVQRLLESAERTGIHQVIMMVEGAGTLSATLANITRLGTEVLPRLPQ